MLPQICVTGNLGTDVDLRYTPDGVPVANATLYCNGRIAKTPAGEQHTETVKCTFWGKVAENAASLLSKGQAVTITGEAVTEAFTRRNGSLGSSFKVERAQFHLINTGNGGARNGNGSSAPAEDDAGAGAPAETHDSGSTMPEPPF